MKNEEKRIKYGLGGYIAISDRLNKPWHKCWSPCFNQDENYVLIHKKHEEVLNAWLMDNDVEIERETVQGTSPYYWEAYDYQNFIENYDEEDTYRLKTLFIKEPEQPLEDLKKEEFPKFEDANFDYEILKEVNGMLIGYIKPENIAFPTSWTKEGIQQQHSPQFDLTPINKLWYENPDNFPAVIHGKFGTVQGWDVDDNIDAFEWCFHIIHTFKDLNDLYEGELNTDSFRLATNEEIDNLKCKG